MKHKNIILIIGVVAITGLVSWLVAGKVFNPLTGHTTVQQVETINPSFPDIKNDAAYKAFLYNGALDPTQPIQIGNSKNQTPFNNGQ